MRNLNKMPKPYYWAKDKLANNEQKDAAAGREVELLKGSSAHCPGELLQPDDNHSLQLLCFLLYQDWKIV